MIAFFLVHHNTLADIQRWAENHISADKTILTVLTTKNHVYQT